MKKKCLMLLALLLAFSLGAGSSMILARDGRTTIEVVYRNIQLMVEGVRVPVPAENEPFIYGGRTYVPLRLVSEALGYDVDWDEHTSTVIIGEASEYLFLSQLKPYEHTRLRGYETITYDNDANMTINRQRYSTGIQIGKRVVRTERDNFPLALKFNLDGKYTRLTGLIGYDDSAERPVGTTVSVYGDETLIRRMDLHHEETRPLHVDLDVSGVTELKIELHVPAQIGLDVMFYETLINLANMALIK